MRTKIAAIVLTLVLGFALVGQASPLMEKEVTDIAKYLNKTIKYPSFAEEKGLEGTVTLLVWIGPDQKLHHSSVKGTDPVFEKFVEESFKRLELRQTKFSNKIGYKKVKIDFKMVN